MKLTALVIAAIGAVLIVSTQMNASTASKPSASSTTENISTQTIGGESPIPQPMATSPRRFADGASRRAFADAISKVRNGAAARATKTYDFSGRRVAAGATTAPIERDTFDKNYIKQRVGEIVPLLAECYEIVLEREAGPATGGAVVVDFVVDAEPEVGGYVAEANVSEDSTLKHPELSECVTETILSLEFMPPEQGMQVRIRYPFVFHMADDETAESP